MSSTTRYRIHPAIGVARVGNSNPPPVPPVTDGFYIGPEETGALPSNADGSPVTHEQLRDADGKMRRQAARFRIFRDDEQQPGGVEVTLDDDDVEGITWTVHLANKKASWYEFLTNAGEYGYSSDHPMRNPDETDRQRLMIDAGPRTVSGRHAREAFDYDNIPQGYNGGFPRTRWPVPAKPIAGPSAYDIETLGEIRTTSTGALLVLGGLGVSGRIAAGNQSITQYANNDGWFDDTSDGPVTATIKLKGGGSIEVEGAWVIVGPPAYAPEILNIVTLYDTIFDGAVRQQDYRPDIFSNGLWQDSYRPFFDTDIKPFLERPDLYTWVTAIPPHPHKLDMGRLGDPDPAYNGYRQYYLDHIRPPLQGNTYATAQGAPLMPFLAGDNALNEGYFTSTYLTVTRTQYFMLQQWAAGKFHAGSAAPLPAGEAIDKGVLDNCVGGAFSPGIEMTWVSRDADIYSAPFRIHRRSVSAGDGLNPGLDMAKGLQPGDVTRYMAVPWQADFNECSVQPITDPSNPDNQRWLWWWPAQRPEIIRRHEDPKDLVAWIGQKQDATQGDYIAFGADVDMVEHWSELGFIVSKKDKHGKVIGYYEYARTYVDPNSKPKP